MNDPATLELLRDARTIGCFQLESPALRRVLASVPIRSMGDLTAALAIVRPGPASGQAKRAYIRRARGSEPVSYWHPAFERVLHSTYGLLLYEEDIASVLASLAGLDMSTADQLRSRLQVHRENPRWLARVERRLLRRASLQGFPEATARAIWRDIQRFAAYSFNKAHATSYALLAYQTAYLKAHAPVEFGCALLNHHVGSYPKRVVASELARSGVVLLPPSVQRSQLACTVESGTAGPAVRVGLGSLKRLRVATLTGALRERRQEGPFEDLIDMLRRVQPNLRELEVLVLSGACDELAPLQPGAYPWLHRAVLSTLRRPSRARTPNDEASSDSDAAWQSLRAALAALHTPRAEGDPGRVALYQKLARVHYELESLEMHLSDHPIRLLREEASRQGRTYNRPRRAQRKQCEAGSHRFGDAQDLGDAGRSYTVSDSGGRVGDCRCDVACRRQQAFRSLDHHAWTVSRRGPVDSEDGALELFIHWLLPFHLRPRPYDLQGSTHS